MIRSILFLLMGALAAGGGVFYLTRPTHDANWWALECEREDLQGRLALQKLRLEAKMGSQDGPESQVIREQVDRNAETLKALRQQVVDLKGEIAETRSAMLATRETHVRETRRLALGKEWAEFISKDGRMYEQVKVAAIDDGGVTLRHLHGSAKLRYTDLTEAQRQMFGIEQDTSMAAEEAEGRRTAAYHQWLENERRQADQRETLAMIASFRSKPTAPVKRVQPQVHLNPPPVTAADSKSSLRIGSLSSPARKLPTSNRIYTRSRNNTYFYSYGGGGGSCAPTYCRPYVTLPAKAFHAP